MNIEHRDESTHIDLQDTAHIEGFGLLENSAELAYALLLASRKAFVSFSR